MPPLPAEPAGIPFRFGWSDQLVGVLHAPAGGAPRQAVLICPPLGREAIWAHRTLRQLALRLARRGVVALRFDPYGTGDSAGDESDWSIARWQEDASSALDVLAREAPGAALTILGLRFGTVLAVRAADARSDVESLVAWHPIAVGADHLADLREVRRVRLRNFPVPVPRSVRRDRFQIVGFRLPEPFARELGAYDARAAVAMRPKSALVLDEAPMQDSLLASHLRAVGTEVTVERADDLVAWSDPIDRVVVPHKTIERVVSWVEAQPAGCLVAGEPPVGAGEPEAQPAGKQPRGHEHRGHAGEDGQRQPELGNALTDQE
jgi:dienelactone hydrolase